MVFACFSSQAATRFCRGLVSTEWKSIKYHQQWPFPSHFGQHWQGFCGKSELMLKCAKIRWHFGCKTMSVALGCFFPQEKCYFTRRVNITLSNFVGIIFKRLTKVESSVSVGSDPLDFRTKLRCGGSCPKVCKRLFSVLHRIMNISFALADNVFSWHICIEHSSS